MGEEMTKSLGILKKDLELVGQDPVAIESAVYITVERERESREGFSLRLPHTQTHAMLNAVLPILSVKRRKMTQFFFF